MMSAEMVEEVASVDDEVRFAADLYRGAAGFYERYRLPYPEAMIEDLAGRTRVSPGGRLLDLACGTGQLAFPLRRYIAEVWAVDQEPSMIDVVRAKAAALGARDVRPIVSSAEALGAEPESFELVVCGNAFHRLQRDPVAGRIFGWLKPGGHLALCWSSSPWLGTEDWKRALAATLERWKTKAGAESRIPEGWERARERRPDRRVLSDAGFEVVARREFTVEHRWSVAELAGHIRSTSFLPAAVLGERGAAFDADLAAALRPHGGSGAFADAVFTDAVFTDTVHFAYDLVRRP
jgi:ubiquinone/menaquinone biosynthesis C-methylase UbiE